MPVFTKKPVSCSQTVSSSDLLSLLSLGDLSPSVPLSYRLASKDVSGKGIVANCLPSHEGTSTHSSLGKASPVAS